MMQRMENNTLQTTQSCETGVSEIQLTPPKTNPKVITYSYDEFVSDGRTEQKTEDEPSLSSTANAMPIELPCSTRPPAIPTNDAATAAAAHTLRISQHGFHTIPDQFVFDPFEVPQATMHEKIGLEASGTRQDHTLPTTSASSAFDELFESPSSTQQKNIAHQYSGI